MKYQLVDAPDSDRQVVQVEDPRVERRHRPLLIAMLGLVDCTTWSSASRRLRHTAEAPPRRALTKGSTGIGYSPANFELPFQCMRPEVSLDYAQPHGQKAAIAFSKYPSKLTLGRDMYRDRFSTTLAAPTVQASRMSLASGAIFLMPLATTLTILASTRAESGGRAFATATWDLVQRLSVDNQHAGRARHARGLRADSGRPLRGALAARTSSRAICWPSQGRTDAANCCIAIAAMFPVLSSVKIRAAFKFEAVQDHLDRVIVDGKRHTPRTTTAAWDNNLLDKDNGLQMGLDACAVSSACTDRHARRG